jgi:mRNA interferase MazF
VIRGSVYRIDLGDPKRGHVQAGKRLGIALSDAPDNWSTVTMVPTSTSAQPAIFRPRLLIAGRWTRALPDHLCTIDVEHVVGDPIDHLSGADMAQVEFAVARFLGLRIELNY